MKDRKKRTLYMPVLVVLLCLLVAGLVFAGGRFIGQGLTEGFETLPVFSLFAGADREQEEAEALQDMQAKTDQNGDPLEDGEAINILLLGIDARDPDENTRSDTMILLSVDAENKEAALISIPRDTKITTRGGVTEKINAVNASEGPRAAAREAGRLLNIYVDRYMVVNFNTFINVVDILGGVDLYVEMDMFHFDDWDPELQIELFEGQQHLDGFHALQYVRYRGGATADIGRTQRQQKFLKALAEKAFRVGSITKIPRLWAEVRSGVNTDLSVSDIGSLVKVAGAMRESEIHNQTVPGNPRMIGGASYWVADEKQLETLVQDVRRGETLTVAGDPDGVGTRRGDRPSAPDYTDKSVVVVEEENGNAAENQESKGIRGFFTGLGDLFEPLISGNQAEPGSEREEETGGEEKEPPNEADRDEEESDRAAGEQEPPAKTETAPVSSEPAAPAGKQPLIELETGGENYNPEIADDDERRAAFEAYQAYNSGAGAVETGQPEPESEPEEETAPAEEPGAAEVPEDFWAEPEPEAEPYDPGQVQMESPLGDLTEPLAPGSAL